MDKIQHIDACFDAGFRIDIESPTKMSDARCRRTRILVLAAVDLDLSRIIECISKSRFGGFEDILARGAFIPGVPCETYTPHSSF
jgi:hypothetical protein